MMICSALRFMARLQVAFLAGVFLTASPSLQQTAADRWQAKQDPRALASHGLIAHEWGTFTSLAGEDGAALEWRPLDGASDLPGFVHKIGGAQNGIRHDYRDKRMLEAYIRMETPVIYFYADRETVVSAKVDFPNGKITEWYPQARLLNEGVDWGRFTVLPRAQVELPTEPRDSHYYPARETDAAILRVCGNRDTQHEKFLFYRGVGNFMLPLTARLEDGRLLIKNTGRETITQAIVFENRGGTVRYGAFDLRGGEAVIELATLGKTSATLERDLERLLIAEALYEKEARAMVKTWRDSWFEEGLRVFYILPRKVTDAVLPVRIEPQPDELVRVLVGRTELITPEMEQEVASSLVKLKGAFSPEAEEEVRRILAKYGRFAQPIVKRVLRQAGGAALEPRLSQLIKSWTR